MSEKVSALIAYAAFCETASETSSSSITDMALLQKDASNSAQAILEMMRHGVVCLRHSKDGKSDESEKEVENVLSLVPLSCLVTVAKAESKPYFKIQASANNACASFSLLSTAENKTHALLHSRLMLILQIIVMSDLYDELIVDSAVEDGLMDLCLNLLTIRDDARYIWPKGNEDYIDVCLVDDEDSSNATADVAMIVGTKRERRGEEVTHGLPHPTAINVSRPCLQMEVAIFCTATFARYPRISFFPQIAANEYIVSAVCEFVHRPLRELGYNDVLEEEGGNIKNGLCPERVRYVCEDGSFNDFDFALVIANVALFCRRFCSQLMRLRENEKTLRSLRPMLLLFRQIIRSADLMRRPNCVVTKALLSFPVVLELIASKSKGGTCMILELGFADELFYLTRLRREEERQSLPWSAQSASERAAIRGIVPRRSVSCEQLAAVMSFLPTEELVRVCALSKDIFVNVVDANEHLHRPLRTYGLSKFEFVGSSMISVLSALLSVAVEIEDTNPKDKSVSKRDAQRRLLSSWELILTLCEDFASASCSGFWRKKGAMIVTILDVLRSCKSYQPAELTAMAERITQSPTLMDAICGCLIDSRTAVTEGLAVFLSICRSLSTTNFLLFCPKSTSDGDALLPCVALFLRAVASEVADRGLMMVGATEDEAIEAFSRLALDVFPLYREFFASLNPYLNRNEMSTAAQANKGAKVAECSPQVPALNSVRESLECEKSQSILAEVAKGVMAGKSIEDLQILLLRYRSILEYRAACQCGAVDIAASYNDLFLKIKSSDTEHLSEWEVVDWWRLLSRMHVMERYDMGTYLTLAEVCHYFFEKTCEQLALVARLSV